jgi:hypothetical protein
VKEITTLDRVLLLITSLLAAYQVEAGIAGKPPLAIAAYTVAFGVLLVAGLLIIIMGFSTLDTPSVAVIASLIPLALSLGLVVEYIPHFKYHYLVFTVLGFTAIFITKWGGTKNLGVIVLAFFHGISGLIIFVLPILLSLKGTVPGRFAFVGVGGGMIGIGGLLLSFLKTGTPILDKQTILALLPGLLLLMTASFLLGFSAV